MEMGYELATGVLAALGGALGCIRGPDSHFCKDRGRECQLELRDHYSNGRDLIRSCRDRNRDGSVATARVRCHTYYSFSDSRGLEPGRLGYAISGRYSLVTQRS
jgi:hypothetical protein